MVTVRKVPGNMEPNLSRVQEGLGWSDKNEIQGVPDSPRENYDSGPSHLPRSFSRSMSMSARKWESSRAPGGSISDTNPPRRNSTPLPSSSSRQTASSGSTLNPRAAEFFLSNPNPVPPQNDVKSNLETRTLGNPASTGSPSEKGSVAAARDQSLDDAAYAATLCLEELEMLDPLLGEEYRAGLFLEEADSASDYQHEILGSRKAAFTRQFLKLQEDAFRAFKSGACTDNGDDDSQVTISQVTFSAPRNQHREETVQQLCSATFAPQLSREDIACTPPAKPDSRISNSSMLGPSQDTNTNGSDPNEEITTDLSSPRAAAEMQAAARKAGEAVNTMEKQLYELEQHLEEFDAEASSGSKPLAPQLSLIRKEYRRTKMCSLDLAGEIANYSRRFSETIIPTCLNNQVPLSERKDALDDYINVARNFGTGAEDIAIQWARIKDQFLKLTASFGGWEGIEEKVKLKDLGYLKEIMANLEVQMESSAHTAKTMNLLLAGAGLTVIAVAAIGLWNFRQAPGKLLGLLCKEITGVQTLAEHTTSVISAGIRPIQNVTGKLHGIREEIQEAEANIHQIEGQIRGLRVRRDQLEELGSRNNTTFSEVIVLCSRIWTRIRVDAVELRGYLESGALNVNRPAFLRSELDKAVKVYILMAGYLRQYAEAINIE
ncbi:hypothetical protein EV426DRAFT_350372 [Tirmania nivea]|nr:hypothetical protein EV426DRAFT_350372 [Tirmania nivea]